VLNSEKERLTFFPIRRFCFSHFHLKNFCRAEHREAAQKV